MTSDRRDEGSDDGMVAGSPAPIRYPTAIAIGGGLAAAVGSGFIPMNAIEGFVSAYGIAELLPAAAPPLGNTARLALSTGIGTLTAGALLALLPREENDDMGYETAVKAEGAADDSANDAAPARSGSGMSKLTGWLRTLRFGKAEADADEITDFADLSRLRMRMGDQHPDAPVRAPIRANSDLGAPFDSPSDTTEPAAIDTEEAAKTDRAPLDLDAGMTIAPPAEKPMASPTFQAPSMRFAPPVAETAALDDASRTEVPDDAAATDAHQADLAAPAHALVQPDPADLAHIAIPDLLDRLERGLARRRDVALAAPKDIGRAGGRIMALPASPAPAFAEPAAEAATDPAPRFRLRASPAAADDGAAASDNDTSAMAQWAEPSEPESPAAITDIAQDDSETDQAVMDAASPPVPPADEDMDAALRDALATLRQLSDRQRNA